MIFQHTWEEVLTGKKTQTRRLMQSGDWFVDRHELGLTPVVLHNTPGKQIARIKWEVGKTYGVQSARGKPIARYGYDDCDGLVIWQAIGLLPPVQNWWDARIRIINIRSENVRDICHEDVIAEGFDNINTFLCVWTQMHDKSAYGYLQCDLLARDYAPAGYEIPEYVWRDWAIYLDRRPSERYQAWAIEFELVQP